MKMKSDLIRPVLAATLLAAIVLLPAVVLAGCGDNRGAGTAATPGNGNKLGSPGQTATVKQGAAVASANAFLAEDLPQGTGRRQEYASNRSGNTVQVSFDLNGPWKFSTGPDETTLTVSAMDKDSAPSRKSFADATGVSAASWERSASGSEYLFYSEDSSSWTIYGRVAADGKVITYSIPSKALIFPAVAGQHWVDNYTETAKDKNGGETRIEVTAENTVVAQNRLIVPAGSFEAWLLQTKVSAKTGDTATTTIDYSWFVPGVGRAAEIISQPGERNDVFTTAKAFYRLKSYK